MFRGRFLGVILTLLLVVGLFGLARNSIYRSGWSDGYVAGQVSGSTEDGEGASGETAPVNPYYRYGPYWGPGDGFFGLFGVILKFFLFFLFLGMIFKFIGFLFFWRKGGWGHSGWGPRGRGMHKHWHHGHRDYNDPPWYEAGEDGEEPVMKA
jgi:hypothetical protein